MSPDNPPINIQQPVAIQTNHQPTDNLVQPNNSPTFKSAVKHSIIVFFSLILATLLSAIFYSLTNYFVITFVFGGKINFTLDWLLLDFDFGPILIFTIVTITLVFLLISSTHFFVKVFSSKIFRILVLLLFIVSIPSILYATLFSGSLILLPSLLIITTIYVLPVYAKKKKGEIISLSFLRKFYFYTFIITTILLFLGHMTLAFRNPFDKFSRSLHEESLEKEKEAIEVKNNFANYSLTYPESLIKGADDFRSFGINQYYSCTAPKEIPASLREISLTGFSTSEYYNQVKHYESRNINGEKAFLKIDSDNIFTAYFIADGKYWVIHSPIACLLPNTDLNDIDINVNLSIRDEAIQELIKMAQSLKKLSN